MRHLTLDTKLNKNKKAAWRIIDDKVIILGVESQTIYMPSDIGSFIWQAINEKKKVSDIIDMVVNVFDVTRQRAQKDTVSFISELNKHNLVILKKDM